MASGHEPFGRFHSLYQSVLPGGPAAQDPDSNDGPLGSTPEMVNLGAFPPRE